MEQRKSIPIGIDLGTAYTRVAAFDGKQWKMIPDKYGESAMPSYVAFTNSGVLVGQDARMQAPQNPTNTIFELIRLIGRRFTDPLVQNDMKRWSFKVIAGPGESLQIEVQWKGKLWQFTPVEIYSMMLMQIKDNAKTYLDANITDAVVSVPALFNYEQRRAIKEAGMIAGLNFFQIISAPAANAMFYGTERRLKYSSMVANIVSLFKSESEYNMIVFDLGAGTLDVAVVTIKGDVCKVRATAGDVHLGGLDFDNNLVDYFVDSLKQKGREDINIPVAISNLRTLCEKAKISLSSGNSMVPMKITPLCNDVDFESIISQAKFIELNNDLFSKCIHIMEACIMNARINIYAVHEVILAGSSTRIPMIKDYILSYFQGKGPIISQNFEAATAYGAACQAFFLSRRENGRGHCLSLLDATPFSLEVRLLQGTMLVCVPKNTSIPFKIEKMGPLKEELFIEVYEDDGSLIGGNNLLGKFELSGAHVSLNWRNVKVCVEMHENGILKVVVEEISSGARKAIILTNRDVKNSQKRVREALLYKEREKILTRGGSSSKCERISEKGTLDKLVRMNKERSEKITGQSSRQYVEPEEYAVGIDFGTTYSSVAVWRQNGVKIIENEYGSRLTSSAVAFTDTCRLIGDTVHKEQVTTNPENTIPNIKRLIGRYCSAQSVHNDSKFLPFRVICGDKNRSMVSVQYKNEEKLFAPEQIAAMILSKMKEIAEAHLSSKVSKAVISVPASFSDSQRKAIKDAGVIAGLNVMQLLNEPMAAAIAYFLQKVSGQNSSEKTLLIFDLGGGNLDVSIVLIKEGSVRVQAVAGDTMLGGEDFDNNMVSHFVRKFKKEKKRDIRNKPRSLRRLRAACEKAKRVLSTNAQTVVEVDALDEGVDFRSVITRKDFEEFNQGLFKRSISCVERCLDDAKLEKSCIDEVVLVGGLSRIPKMQQLLQEFFKGKELCKSMNADEAVVYGAAVQAAILSGNEDRKKFNIIELQDVTSLSFGLQNKEGATLNLFIPKHTAIPAKKELIFSNCSDYLSSFLIEVQECESASTTVFTASGIVPKPRGNSKINLSFEVDNNGILNLTAKDITVRGEKEIVISKENGSLTLEEIQKMAEAAARYKAEDEAHKVRAAALNSIENLAYKIKAIARDLKLSSPDRKVVEKVTDEAIAWQETGHHAGIDEINARKSQLENIKSQLISFVGP